MAFIPPVLDHNLPAARKTGDITYPEHSAVVNPHKDSQEPWVRETPDSNIRTTLDSIKTAILKYVAAKKIYLFGSYAYGLPTSKSDIDIYTVVPDNTHNMPSLYVKVMTDLNDQGIYFIDLLFGKESIFDRRKHEYILEKTIYHKGKLLYES
jgi:predicted nucleotidyltransferase